MKEDELLFERRPIDDDLLRPHQCNTAAIYVDFDFTLFGSNSTELFIASCRPSIAAAVIEFAVRRCVPWRFTRIQHWFRLGDYACCLVLLAVMPWNLFRWRRMAPAVFERYASPSMQRALHSVDVQRLSIISFGMSFIVAALLRETPWRSVPLIATPLRLRPSLLTRGKRAILTDAVGADAVARSVFVTDSLDDADLLAAVETGILVEPQGPVFRASEHLYIPLRYTARAKYTPSYLLDQVALVELALLVISVCRSLSELPVAILTTGLLYLSVMCIYEIGYVENDTAGAQREQQPRLTPEAARYRSYPIEPSAWIWAALLGVAGIAALIISGSIDSVSQAAVALLAWAAALAALRFTFYHYNGPNLVRRLHLYPLLQLLKFLPVLVLVRPTTFGAVLILCQIATMWAIYLTYRMGGRSGEVLKEPYRVLMLAVGAVLFCLTPAVHEPGLAFQLAALGLWSLVRLGKASALRALGKSARV